MSTLAPPSLAPVLSYGPAANRGDRNFFGIITGGVLLVPLLVFGFLIVLIAGAWPAIHNFGWSFITGKTWDANAEGGELFGALPFIYGTMVTAIGALLVAAPIGVGDSAGVVDEFDDHLDLAGVIRLRHAHSLVRDTAVCLR